LLPFVLHNLLSVCFRGASATSNAILMLPSSFANCLVSLDFYDTLDQQKELAFAFGGQHSIQLSYGCSGARAPITFAAAIREVRAS